MAKSLSNVYAFLRSKYSTVDISYTHPVSYIKTLTNADSKIIFIYKEDKTRKASSSSSDSYNDTSKKLRDSIDLDLTGSPLKDDCHIDMIDYSSLSNAFKSLKPWSDVEETFTPIDIDLAKEILISLNEEEFHNAQGSVWILCKGDSMTFLLEGAVDNGWNSRGSVTYQGQTKDVPVKQILGKHFSFIPTATKLETYVEMTFNVNPQIQLKFINNSSSKNPILHVNAQSDVILFQKVEIGRNHFLCEGFWDQINVLNMIKDDITAYRNNPDQNKGDPVYSWESGLDIDILQEKVQKILSDVVVLEEDPQGDIGFETVIKKAKKRPLNDITDQLWDLLRFSSSYMDLKRIFTFIFQVAARSNIVNIPTNHNRLAELIRELSQQRLAIPKLTETEPLELLLEIGIEKLLKDYEFIFSESKICKFSEIKNENKCAGGDNLNIRKSLVASVTPASETSDKMRKTLLHRNGTEEEKDDIENLGIRNSRFSENESNMKIAKLIQIHLAIEHLLLAQNNLNFQLDYTSISKKILEKDIVLYDRLGKFDHLEIPILNKDANHLVENIAPNSKKIVMKSENRFKKVENVFYYNLDMITPSHVVGEEQKLDMAAAEKEDCFHYMHYTKIATQAL